MSGGKGVSRSRILVGLAASAIVLLVFMVDHYWTQGLVVAAFIAAIAFVASWELCVILESGGMASYPWTASLGSFVIALVPSVVFFMRWPTDPMTLQTWVLVAFLLASFAVAVFRAEPVAGTRAVMSGVLVLVYVGLGLSFLARVRFMPGIGESLLYLAVASAKFGDIGAYFAGRTLGRHKLAPRVSPNKTIEGAVGGVAAAVIAAAALWPTTGGAVSVWIFIIWGVVINVVAQLSDLAESLVKRASEVKDSSIAFGTMGGMLDMVDSLLLSAPVAYVLALAFGFAG